MNWVTHENVLNLKNFILINVYKYRSDQLKLYVLKLTLRKQTSIKIYLLNFIVEFFYKKIFNEIIRKSKFIDEPNNQLLYKSD